MKSGGWWNLGGLHPAARETARAPVRQSGASVGEWLNRVIRPVEDGGPPLRGDNLDREDYGLGHDRADRPRRKQDREHEREARPHEGAGDAARLHEAARDAARMRAEVREAARAREELGEVHARLDRLSRQLERLGGAEIAPPEAALPQRPSTPAPGQAGDGRGPLLPSAPQPPRRAVADSLPDHSRPVEPAAAGDRSLPDHGSLPAEPGDLLIDRAVAEITARQRALDDDTPAQPAFGAPPAATAPPPLAPAPFESRTESPRSEKPLPDSASALTLGLSSLERQLRQITTQIEALRPTSDLETAIKGLRADLAEIGRALTEALPRRAVESLEIEVKALAQRIDRSRQCGVDSTALADLDRGLAEVRDALRGLMTAESLIGMDEAVKALTQKVDALAAKQDAAALRPLETAIADLRNMVANVASNDALTKVAEDVCVLAAKVDSLATSAASGQAVATLESRMDALTSALNASTEAGHALPKEFEKLLSGLIDKLEWVQLTHTDHAALAHLEDRITMLVKRLDASDARLGPLEGVERGLADLLVHIEQLRGGANGAAEGANISPVAVDVIEREVAEIKQAERRTQDSLETVQDTVQHVVDRLAMIESGMRIDKTTAAPAEPPAGAPPSAASEPAPVEAAAPLLPAVRPPLDPSLPPDHPLEPGFTATRPRQPPSAADRIAASEAAVGSTPPVIPDPGGKPDFIAAARRAAQAAAAASLNQQPGATGAAAGAPPKKLTERLRTLIVAGAVVFLVVGCYHVASRWFDDGGSVAPLAPQKATPQAGALPDKNPMKAPKPEATQPPSAIPGGTISAKPGQQSLLNDTAAPSATMSSMPPADGTATVGGTVDEAALWAMPDITGSLPPSARHGTAPASAPTTAALGDKLPATIGGPALRAAALAGDASAAYEVAMRFAEGRGVPQNDAEAARWFERAAKGGLAPAQFRLAGLYEKGMGVKKDLATARDLYRAAADKGNARAMHNLAVLYAEGIDGAADYRNAAAWFRKAADHGITDSQYNLGILYARGIGVEQNSAEAYKWFLLAAKEGDKEAARKRDEVASRLDPQSLATARLAAQNWKPEPQPADAITVKAAGASDPPAKAAPAARPKPRSAAGKPQPPDAAKLD